MKYGDLMVVHNECFLLRKVLCSCDILSVAFKSPELSLIEDSLRCVLFKIKHGDLFQPLL